MSVSCLLFHPLDFNIFNYPCILSANSRLFKDVKTLLSIPNIEFGKLVFCITSNDFFSLLTFLLLVLKVEDVVCQK
jgi:hypothetical protein